MFEFNHLPTSSAKEKERAQLKAEVEEFLANGGKIQELPSATVKRVNTVNVKKSTE